METKNYIYILFFFSKPLEELRVKLLKLVGDFLALKKKEINMNEQYIFISYQ